MAEENSIAKAYVQIVPTTNGVQSNITKLLGGEGESAGKAFMSKMSGFVTQAVEKVGQAISSVVKQSISAGGALEQSIGGVQTLYKESAQTMIENANSAFSRMQISANDYMEQATSFSASLISSLDGDTAKAAEYADLAISNMSDNANKMGTNLGDIQNAYQGFAKQNYTMLDNLKLGYGGTQSEMIRLINDSGILNEEISSLDGISFDQIILAISKIQDNLGMTGVSADEAKTTLEGSFNQMSAAWENLLAQLAVGNMEDVSRTASELASSAATYLFGNLLPAIGNIIKQLPTMITSFVQTALPAIKEQGGALLQTIVTGWQEKKGDWGTAIQTSLDNALTWISESLPDLLAKGLEAMDNFISGWGSGDGHVMAAIGTTIGKVLLILIESLPQILATGAQMILKLAAGFIMNIPYLVKQGGVALDNLKNSIIANLPSMLTLGKNILNNIMTGFGSKVSDFSAKAREIGDKIKTTFQNTDWAAIGRNIIQGIINGLKNAIGGLVTSAANAAKSALNSAKSALGIHSPSKVFELQVGRMIDLGLAEGISNNTKPVQDSMEDLSMSAVGVFMPELGSISNVGRGNSFVQPQGYDTQSMSRAFVSALEEYGLTIKTDGREFGRVVKGAFA